MRGVDETHNNVEAFAEHIIMSLIESYRAHDPLIDFFVVVG